MNLTPRQLEILNFILDYRKEKSYAPTLQEIAKHFQVSTITIFEHVRALQKKGAIIKEKHKARAIDVLPPENFGNRKYALSLMGYISAGRPIEAVEDKEVVDFSDVFLSRENLLLFRVQGNSLADEHINDGDYVVVEKRDWADNGETVLAQLENGQTTIKKYYKERGQERLESVNPNATPQFVSNVKIHGVVLGIVRKY